MRSLTITVDVVPDAHSRYAAVARRCDGERQPVPAIGNEALRCTMKPHGETVNSERIVGRVRDQLFSVTLSTTMKHDPSLTPGELAMRIYSAAEEVSGNLY